MPTADDTRASAAEANQNGQLVHVLSSLDIVAAIDATPDSLAHVIAIRQGLTDRGALLEEFDSTEAGWDVRFYAIAPEESEHRGYYLFCQIHRARSSKWHVHMTYELAGGDPPSRIRTSSEKFGGFPAAMAVLDAVWSGPRDLRCKVRASFVMPASPIVNKWLFANAPAAQAKLLAVTWYLQETSTRMKIERVLKGNEPVAISVETEREANLKLTQTMISDAVASEWAGILSVMGGK
jgi:hypothetical protein